MFGLFFNFNLFVEYPTKSAIFLTFDFDIDCLLLTLLPKYPSTNSLNNFSDSILPNISAIGS